MPGLITKRPSHPSKKSNGLPPPPFPYAFVPLVLNAKRGKRNSIQARKIVRMKQNMLRFLKTFEKEVKLRRMRTRQQMPQLCESSVVFVFFSIYVQIENGRICEGEGREF